MSNQNAAALAANALADSMGVEISFIRVLCIRCAKALTDPLRVSRVKLCEWSPTSTKCNYGVAQEARCRTIPLLALPFAWALVAHYQEFVDSPSEEGQDAVVAAARVFAGREATSREGGVQEVTATTSGLDVTERQLATTLEGNRLLKQLKNQVSALLVPVVNNLP